MRTCSGTRRSSTSTPSTRTTTEEGLPEGRRRPKKWAEKRDLEAPKANSPLSRSSVVDFCA